MAQIRIRTSHIIRTSFAASFLLAAVAATNAQSGDGGDSGDDSVIDIIIDWIEDLFDPEPPQEEPPADGDSW